MLTTMEKRGLDIINTPASAYTGGEARGQCLPLDL